jgi:hypothetical protein
MKKVLFIALAVLGVSLGMAQSYQTIATDSSYASNDTTAWFSISPARTAFYTLGIAFNVDTVNVAIYVDYYGRQGSTLKYNTYSVVSDSTNWKDVHAPYYGYPLRTNDDNIPGAMKVRLRILKRSTGGDSGTQTYRADLGRD